MREREKGGRERACIRDRKIKVPEASERWRERERENAPKRERVKERQRERGGVKVRE